MISLRESYDSLREVMSPGNFFHVVQKVIFINNCANRTARRTTKRRPYGKEKRNCPSAAALCHSEPVEESN